MHLLLSGNIISNDKTRDQVALTSHPSPFSFLLFLFSTFLLMSLTIISVCSILKHNLYDFLREDMGKKQVQLVANSAVSRKAASKNTQKQITRFVNITLFKPDLEELIQLLQNHLQDVEIFIDDQRILESGQLAQFDENYQAMSLQARGYWPETTGENAEEPEKRLLIELTMNKLMVILSTWKTLEKSAFIVQLKKLLIRRTTFVQQTLQWVIFGLFIAPVYSISTQLFSLWEYRPFVSFPHILQVFIDFFVGILTVPAFVALFAVTIIRLKLDTRNFLFPGKTRITRTHHRFNMVGRLLVAVVLFALIEGFLIIGSALLWRFWR